MRYDRALPAALRHARLLLAFLAAAVIAQVVFSQRAASSEYLIVEGAGQVPLNVIAAGPEDAPAILFVHGIGQSHLSWERQFESDLAERYRLVAFDLRGHANSGKPWQKEAYADSKAWADDIDAIISALELKKPVLVGWSYGSLVAMDYVRHHGVKKLAGINLIGAYGGLTAPPPQDDSDQSGESSDLAETFAVMRQKQNSPNIADNLEASRYMVGWLTAKEMSPAWRERAVAIGIQLPPYVRQAMWARPLQNQDLLVELKLPVLLTVGTEDLGSPFALGRPLAESLPDGEVSVYKGIGHSPFLEDTDRFNDELKRFVDRASRD